MEWKLIKGTAAGFAAHQTNPMIEGWEARPGLKPGWTRLARYGIGGLTFVPCGRMMFRHLFRQGMSEEEAVDTFTAASIVALVAIMVGVVVGYLLDGLLERLK